MKRFSLLLILACSSLNLNHSQMNAAEAFEVGPHSVAELPRGKEADGIIGDFILRNDKIEAVISHNTSRRRPNMSTFYGATGITPGCLYDLTLRGAHNDQITIFAPSAQQGPVSYVRIVPGVPEGQAAVETVVSAANNEGLYKRHEYRLADHAQGVLIITHLRNESGQTKTIKTADRWTTVTQLGVANGITVANAIDPADKAGYAYAWIESGDLKAPPSEIKLAAGAGITYARFLSIGNSPGEAFGIVAANREPTGTLSGWIRDAQHRAIPSSQVDIKFANLAIPVYPNDQGFFRVSLPKGTYSVAVQDIGRESVERSVEIAPKIETELSVELSSEAAIAFKILDELGRSIPCKAQFIGINGTKSPNLGPQNRAHGCVDQYFSERGNFRVQVPPGSYKVIVTRGMEYSHLAHEIKLMGGETGVVSGTLKRLVQSPGWVSADFHNHSTPSGDNTCGTDDRVISLAAEHIEFAPTTEHNRLYDWRPHIENLGLSEYLNTVSGVELTGSGAHFNAFPYSPVPHTQDAGAPVWEKDPRLNAITLRDYQGFRPDRWIQINHPDLVENFFDRDGDGRIDGGFLGLGKMIDGFETQNGNSANILAGAPYQIFKNSAGKDVVAGVREFIWLQMLNQGFQIWAQAVSDAHSVYGNGVGGWRCYVASSTDHPGQLNWAELSRASKSGRIILTSGPYLEVSTVDGVLPGGLAHATDSVEVNVRVQCTDWIDIDRIQILVNGAQRPDLNFTRESHPGWFQDGVVKFERVIKVPLQQDSHIIVVAYGEKFDLKTGFGSSPQSQLKPCAYNNPIFVDVDGGGFSPNGDTLGFSLPSAQSNVETVRSMLEARRAK
ncbi:MAG: CehA/McbA family metallohydrolase [Verrucomicrobia bacterium]|nr:CehA/McbA family metallohydrolase [Verrucomicrobiota bacterium]